MLDLGACRKMVLAISRFFVAGRPEPALASAENGEPRPVAGIPPSSASAGSAAFAPRRSAMKKLLTVLLATGTFVLAACNTVEGAGRDIQSVGDCVDGRPNNC
jgi:predicted small secreted protein